MHPARTHLDPTICNWSVQLLDTHLATASGLHAHFKQSLSNVEGTSFIAIHELFDSVLEEIETIYDLLAELAGSLGDLAGGAIRSVAKKTPTIDRLLCVMDEQQHILAISGALAAFGDSVRKSNLIAAASGDLETAGVFR
jgi:starvation-inducible DNA-binding protein